MTAPIPARPCMSLPRSIAFGSSVALGVMVPPLLAVPAVWMAVSRNDRAAVWGRIKELAQHVPNIFRKGGLLGTPQRKTAAAVGVAAVAYVTYGVVHDPNHEVDLSKETAVLDASNTPCALTSGMSRIVGEAAGEMGSAQNWPSAQTEIAVDVINGRLSGLSNGYAGCTQDQVDAARTIAAHSAGEVLDQSRGLEN